MVLVLGRRRSSSRSPRPLDFPAAGRVIATRRGSERPATPAEPPRPPAIAAAAKTMSARACTDRLNVPCRRQINHAVQGCAGCVRLVGGCLR